MSSSSIVSNLGVSGNKSTDESFLQDQDKQQISFFINHFPVKNSDQLVATAVQKVLDFQFLKVLRSVRPPLRLCKILMQLVTFRLLSGHLESVSHYPCVCSVCFQRIFKLIKNLDHQSFIFCLIFCFRIQHAHTKPSTRLYFLSELGGGSLVM